VDQTWRGRIGSSLLGAVVGALIGWALSLTQGSHPRRWPWMLVGAVVVAALALILWERKLAPRFVGDAPDRRSRKVLDVFGKALTRGAAVQDAFEESPDDDRPVRRWEKTWSRRIRSAAGGHMAGLFATASSVIPERPLPSGLRGMSGAAETWDRLDRKLQWLRYQSKVGPHR
jgi:uncharacterized membrane protein YfcA